MPRFFEPEGAKQIPKVIMVRPPALGLRFEPYSDATKGTHPHPTILATPLTSQLTVAAVIRDGFEKLSHPVSIEIVDMRSPCPDSPDHPRVEEYKQFDYCGKGVMRCFEVSSHGLNEVQDKINGSDIICLSAIFTTEAAIIARFITSCKCINPTVKIIVGGKDATARPDFYLEAGADLVVQGHGMNISEIVEKILQNDSVNGIPGVVTATSRTPLLQSQSASSLLALPAFDLIENLEYYSASYTGHYPEGVSGPIAYNSFSLGCINACRYCTTAGQSYHYLSVEEIAKVLDHYKRHGVRIIGSGEDNPLLRMQKRFEGQKGGSDIIKIMRMIRELGFAFEFTNGLQMGLLDSNREGMFTIDHELASELFKHFYLDGKLVGTFRLTWPLESFDAGTREDQKLRKLPSWDRLLKLIEVVSEMRIPQILFALILFHNNGPEQAKEIRDKCSKIRRLVMEKSGGVTSPHFSIYNEMFLPGTINFADPERTKLVRYPINEYPELWGAYTPAYDGTRLPIWELFKFRRKLAIHANSKGSFDRGPPFWVPFI